MRNQIYTHFLTVLLVTVASTGLCASLPTTVPAATRPTDFPGVDNFAQVSQVLYRGGQPTADGFVQLKKHGIKTIVNLRSFHSDRDMLKGTGLHYINIPEKAWRPEDQDTARFLKILEDPANQPVFVHCAQGSDRTGCSVAAYRMLDQGWNAGDALAEMRIFHFHPIWSGITRYILNFDAQTMRKRVDSIERINVEIEN